MAARFCPGYPPPFDALVDDCPGDAVYPTRDFRTEWGPIFHRGRLDGTAKVLVLGQDPATHETISRRILVGEAGQRVQGLLAKAGLTSSYVLLNTFLYSVYGQGGGTRHAKDPDIAQYRDRWIDTVVAQSPITAVVTLGDLAKTAYRAWAKTRPEVAGPLHLAAVRHPTFPEGSSRSGGGDLAQATVKLLQNWNDALPALRAHVAPDDGAAGPLVLYGDTWQSGDLWPIPEADLPAGTPPWWRDLEGWAQRTGSDTQTKRATVTVTVPPHARTWPGAG